MAKASFKLKNELIPFLFPKLKPDGQGNNNPIDPELFKIFEKNFDNFYLNRKTIDPTKLYLFEVSITYENGRTYKWGMGFNVLFDDKQEKPEIILKSITDKGEDFEFLFEISGEFDYKFSPKEKLRLEHEGWEESKIEIRLNFRENFLNTSEDSLAKAIKKTGNIFAILKDVKNKFEFNSDF